MAANGEVIKSFLVGLGFDVDEGSLAVFNKSIRDATLRITALYGTVNALASGIVYAFSQISDGFEQMGYQYHIIAPSINKLIVLRQELMKSYQAAGIDIRKVIVDSVKLNLSLTKTKYAMEAIYKSVGSKFFSLLTKESDIFRKKLYDNMPYIIGILTKLVNTVFRAFTAVTLLGGRVWSILGRVYDFFVMLDKATDGWSTVILSVIAAWKLLNLSFLATPLGQLLALGVAILALYDDFKTWQEGGQSLINWGSEFTQMIIGLIATVGALATAFYVVKGALAAWSAISGVITLIKELNVVLAVTEGIMLVLEAPIWLIVGAIAALVAGLTLADEKWKIFGGGLSGFFSGVGNTVTNLMGGGPGGKPLGTTPSNTSNNVNANMQTQINIQGSPNADATARSVGAQQQNVNRDYVRNLKGATR